MTKQIIIIMLLLVSVFTMQASAIDNATDKMNNLSAANTTISADDYDIMMFLEHDENESAYTNTRNIITSPVRFAASGAFLGYWFYCFCMLIVLIYVYGKSKSVEITSMVMMLMSILVIVPSMTSSLIVPMPFLVLMYVMALLGFAGIFGFLGNGD